MPVNAGAGSCDARFAAAAAQWPDVWCSDGCEDGYDITRYDTSPEALAAYAAFHASRASDPTAKTLVFKPNQYGLGNRLRAMKSALLVAMLTGRVFRTHWHEPYPLDAIVEPEQIDWRTPADGQGEPEAQGVMCLPFATAGHLPSCTWHMQQLQKSDLRVAYAKVHRLEVFVFTDLNIYLAHNPHYEALLRRLGASCPKRMGCLFDFLFAPGPRLRERLDAVLPPLPPGAQPAVPSSAYAEYVAVQVRNRLWRIEAMGQPAFSNTASRVVGCLGRWVPTSAVKVFFTADDDSLRPAAKQLWAGRLIEIQGGVYEHWSRGGKVEREQLADSDEEAVLKAFADWFALRHASLLVWTYGSSFGKTAAAASGAPNIDVNHTRCAEDEATGVPGGSASPSVTNVQYDVSKVPGAKG